MIPHSIDPIGFLLVRSQYVLHQVLPPTPVLLKVCVVGFLQEFVESWTGACLQPDVPCLVCDKPSSPVGGGGTYIASPVQISLPIELLISDWLGPVGLRGPIDGGGKDFEIGEMDRT